MRDPTVIERIKQVSDFDSLGLRNPNHRLHQALKRMLEKYGEQMSTELLTDYMYRFNSKFKKSKRILLVTDQSLYCLSRHKVRVEARISLKYLTKISLIKNSSALMQLTYEESEELPMETLKRTELVYFVVRQADKYGWNRPALVQSTSLKIPKDKASSLTVTFEKARPSKKDDRKSEKSNIKVFQSLISTNFVNASLVGHLERYRGKKLFRRDWKQNLCVLTNVGILQYDEPDDKKPSNLYSIIDMELNELKTEVYQKSYVFSLKSFSEEVVFAALSQTEYNSWIIAVTKLKNETDFKMRKIAERQNIQEAISSRSSKSSSKSFLLGPDPTKNLIEEPFKKQKK